MKQNRKENTSRKKKKKREYLFGVVFFKPVLLTWRVSPNRIVMAGRASPPRMAEK
jgi:hypothetical protein